MQGSKGFGPQGLFPGFEQRISLWQLFRSQFTVQRQVRPKPAPPADLAQGPPRAPRLEQAAHGHPLSSQNLGARGLKGAGTPRGWPHACPSVPEKAESGRWDRGLQTGAFRASQLRTPGAGASSSSPRMQRSKNPHPPSCPAGPAPSVHPPGKSSPSQQPHPLAHPRIVLCPSVTINFLVKYLSGFIGRDLQLAKLACQ